MTDKQKSLYAALAAAQSEMGKALKDSNNPHFKSKYADLASVMDACMPSLTKHGIAVLQPPYHDETGRYVKTILVYGETGEMAECLVPLIIGKNDMQGYGSAVTYARRYGLMSMAGIAPEDDDGNAAGNGEPITFEQMQEILTLLNETGSDTEAFCQYLKIDAIKHMPAAKFEMAMKALQAKKAQEIKPND